MLSRVLRDAASPKINESRWLQAETGNINTTYLYTYPPLFSKPLGPIRPLERIGPLAGGDWGVVCALVSTEIQYPPRVSDISY